MFDEAYIQGRRGKLRRVDPKPDAGQSISMEADRGRSEQL